MNASNDDPWSDSSFDEADDLLVLEEVDSILEAEDPAFTTDFQNLEAEEEIVQVEQKEEKPYRPPLLTQIRIWYSNKVEEFKENLRQRRAQFKQRVVRGLEFTVYDLPPLARRKAIAGFWSSLRGIKWGGVTAFHLSLIKKLVLMINLSLIGLVFYVIYMMTATENELMKLEPFLGSFESVATRIEIYRTEDLDGFYNSLRSPSGTFELPPLVVNILPSRGSTRNPMALIEFVVESPSKEVLHEVESKQVYFKDIISRHLETKRYAELQGRDYKRMLANEVMDIMNQNIRAGRLREVYLKSIVSKP